MDIYHEGIEKILFVQADDFDKLSVAINEELQNDGWQFLGDYNIIDYPDKKVFVQQLVMAEFSITTRDIGEIKFVYADDLNKLSISINECLSNDRDWKMMGDYKIVNNYNDDYNDGRLLFVQKLVKLWD